MQVLAAPRVVDVGNDSAKNFSELRRVCDWKVYKLLRLQNLTSIRLRRVIFWLTKSNNCSFNNRIAYRV